MMNSDACPIHCEGYCPCFSTLPLLSVERNELTHSGYSKTVLLLAFLDLLPDSRAFPNCLLLGLRVSRSDRDTYYKYCKLKNEECNLVILQKC